MRWVLIAVSLVLSNSISAQWAVGAETAAFSTDRLKEFLFGVGVRGEHRLDARCTLFGEAISTIPFNSRVDEVLGGARFLPVGDTTLRRVEGREYDMRQQLEIGVIGRIGRSRNGQGKAHPYWGIGIGAHRYLYAWNLNVTLLSSGTQYSSQDAYSLWYMAVSPMLGYRTRAVKGRFLFEARAVLLKQVSRIDDSSPETQFMATIGYLWGL